MIFDKSTYIYCNIFHFSVTQMKNNIFGQVHGILVYLQKGDFIFATAEKP
jgi:hypothetical protein